MLLTAAAAHLSYSGDFDGKHFLEAPESAVLFFARTGNDTLTVDFHELKEQINTALKGSGLSSGEAYLVDRLGPAFGIFSQKKVASTVRQSLNQLGLASLKGVHLDEYSHLEIPETHTMGFSKAFLILEHNGPLQEQINALVSLANRDLSSLSHDEKGELSRTLDSVLWRIPKFVESFTYGIDLEIGKDQALRAKHPLFQKFIAPLYEASILGFKILHKIGTRDAKLLIYLKGAKGIYSSRPPASHLFMKENYFSEMIGWYRSWITESKDWNPGDEGWTLLNNSNGETGNVAILSQKNWHPTLYVSNSFFPSWIPIAFHSLPPEEGGPPDSRRVEMEQQIVDLIVKTIPDVQKLISKIKSNPDMASSFSTPDIGHLIVTRVIQSIGDLGSSGSPAIRRAALKSGLSIIERLLPIKEKLPLPSQKALEQSLSDLRKKKCDELFQ